VTGHWVETTHARLLK